MTIAKILKLLLIVITIFLLGDIIWMPLKLIIFVWMLAGTIKILHNQQPNATYNINTWNID